MILNSRVLNIFASSITWFCAEENRKKSLEKFALLSSQTKLCSVAKSGMNFSSGRQYCVLMLYSCLRFANLENGFLVE